ncbi:DUF4169 family protein [Sphingomonas sp.]|uniref:DUF4169 family protein n=1 Tax=Sphingomonas sp. TaxID=28214 RepID=UPI000DB14CE6|nr:DUF4169 family protein [Sphingomonas sp.]PZU11497.1 MAG: DUF4169 domain-containing protein [Sphingomonas sp.]
MGDVVNLRAARKARMRTAARTQADANRALHGRTAAERKRDRDDATRLARIVDGAKLDEDENRGESD